MSEAPATAEVVLGFASTVFASPAFGGGVALSEIQS